jgi:glutamine synthetase
VDSEEGYWNRGRGFGSDRNGTPNLGYKLRSRQGYFPAAPGDTHGDLRARMVTTLESMGIRCEFHHHEVGSAGQAEINVRFQPLLKMADQLQLQKYVVKNVAAQAGKSATFMPKPVFEENGSGMHVHISLAQGGGNVLYDFDGYGLLSRGALNFIGGLLAHGRALMAFCAPTTNSYRGWCPATRRRSTSSTRSETARRPAVSPCTRPPRSRSVWSSARPTLRPIPTWPSRRC